MTKQPDQSYEKFQRPKRKPRLKPGKSIKVSAEDKARYEALINKKDQQYEATVSQDRRKV